MTYSCVNCVDTIDCSRRVKPSSCRHQGPVKATPMAGKLTKDNNNITRLRRRKTRRYFVEEVRYHNLQETKSTLGYLMILLKNHQRKMRRLAGGEQFWLHFVKEEI